MRKLVIIPAYNEAESIVRTVGDIRENAPGFDYVIVNDCSRDSTEALCREQGFPVISLAVNLGIGGAVQTGYLYALEKGYDMAVQFDGDGQHDAKFLESMGQYLQEQGAGMVIGSRFLEKKGFQSSGLRRFGIRYFTGVIRLLTGRVITDPTSGMRMTDRKVMTVFANNYPGDYPEPESVVAVLEQKIKVVEFPVLMRERRGGTSSISPMGSVFYMLKVTLAIFMEKLRRY